MDGVPLLSAAERSRLAGLPADPETHTALMRELGFADAVDIGPAPPTPAGDSLRVVAWNAERCRSPEAGATLLGDADVALLSEMDWGMARTGQRHTARDISRELARRTGAGWGHAYAVEFLELGLGNPEERAAWAGSENEVGYHGGAIVGRHPFESVRVVRLGSGGEWFDGSRGERRIGARIALLATLRLGGRRVALAAAHLESHGEPEERAAQMQTLVSAIDSLDPAGAEVPALIGGDLNSLSLGRSALEEPTGIQRALAEDPERLAHPMPHEPLFEVAAGAGFEWDTCNRPGEPTHRPVARAGQPSRRGKLKLDRFLSRGLTCEGAEVVDAIDPGSGDALSDHEAIAVTIR